MRGAAVNARARIPLALTLLRALLAPVMVAAALYAPSRALFGVCLTVAFLSDVFDGIIARRLGVVTPGLRRLDSIVDTIFYVCVVFAAWTLHRSALAAHAMGIAVLVALELARYAFDWIKFRRVASYHMWSAKLWGILLFVAFFALLAFGRGGWFLSLAIYTGIVADVEGLAISLVLPESRTDVASIVHARRGRQGARPSESFKLQAPVRRGEP